MPITDLLERNAKLYGNDIALVEINPERKETRRITWKEYELIEPSRAPYYRREITWNVFNEKSNRFANILLSRGVHKGDKVAILADELPGMAPHLLRHLKDRSFGCPSELSLFL